MFTCMRGAPLMTQGATRSVGPKPAIRVWVPQDPKGADAVSLLPRRGRPRIRVRLVLTDVLSMSTTRSGIALIAGTRCANQSARARFTLARLRSSAMRLFFVRITQPLEGLIDAGDGRGHIMRIPQSALKFLERDVRVLMDQLD